MYFSRSSVGSAPLASSLNRVITKRRLVGGSRASILFVRVGSRRHLATKSATSLFMLFSTGHSAGAAVPPPARAAAAAEEASADRAAWGASAPRRFAAAEEAAKERSRRGGGPGGGFGDPVTPMRRAKLPAPSLPPAPDLCGGLGGSGRWPRGGGGVREEAEAGSCGVGISSSGGGSGPPASDR